jgi:hypothetical protein
MRYLLLFLSVLMTLMSNAQCPQCEAYEAPQYRTTNDTLSGGLSKYVQSDWFRIDQKSEVLVFLCYRTYPFLLDGRSTGGIYKGSISFRLGAVGEIHNAKVQYEDGTFEIVSPFTNSFRKDKAAGSEASFAVRGDLFDFEYRDKYINGVYSMNELNEGWIKGRINIAKPISKMTFLTDDGTVEVIWDDGDQLKLSCILDRFKTPRQEDSKR